MVYQFPHPEALVHFFILLGLISDNSSMSAKNLSSRCSCLRDYRAVFVAAAAAAAAAVFVVNSFAYHVFLLKSDP